jgi:hypothetical protein
MSLGTVVCMRWQVCKLVASPNQWLATAVNPVTQLVLSWGLIRHSLTKRPWRQPASSQFNTAMVVGKRLQPHQLDVKIAILNGVLGLVSSLLCLAACTRPDGTSRGSFVAIHATSNGASLEYSQERPALPVWNTRCVQARRWICSEPVDTVHFPYSRMQRACLL